MINHSSGGAAVVTLTWYASICTIIFFYDHFYFPAQLVAGFHLSDLPDKPWSQVLSLSPPDTCLQFLSRIGFSIPAARRFPSNVPINNSRSRAFRWLIFYARKSPYEYEGMCTRWELNSRKKLISVGRRITYEATGDARCLFSFFFSLPPINSRNSDPGSHTRLFSPSHNASCLAFFSQEDFSSFFPRRFASN